MVECCKTCRYFDHYKCSIHNEIFENDNPADSMIEYAIGEGIVAEKVNESLDGLKLSDDDKEILIEYIENIIKSCIDKEPNQSGFKIKDYNNFKCNRYE